MKDILLVEDNLINQRLAIAIFRKANYTFDTADNGKDALKLVQKNKYGIILMDIQMPIMDGIEATIEIRKYEDLNKLIPTPIFAVTAYTEENDTERFLDIGINDCIRKPFNYQQLIEFIEKNNNR
ncbi:MAG: response regulator [Hyphomicrobiales bacterium]